MVPGASSSPRLTPASAEALVLLLAALGNVATVRLLPSGAYVPANFALALLAVAAARWADLTSAELGLGLDGATLRCGLLAGTAAAGLVLCGYALALLLPAMRQAIAAQPVPPDGRFGVAYESLIRIPVGTALAEEVLFRGALLGLALRRASPARAVASTSLWFALWHILPTLANLAASRPAGMPPTTGEQAQAVTLALIVTFVGGGIFSLLRLRSGSVLAPTLLHTTLNLAGFWAVRIAVG